MVSEPLEPSNWRLIERSSFTSVTKTVTKTSDPIDCDEPEIPEQTTTNKCSQSFGGTTFENNRPVYDRTEPNLPNTEASVRYYSVRFGSVGSRNTEPNLPLVLEQI